MGCDKCAKVRAGGGLTYGSGLCLLLLLAGVRVEGECGYTCPSAVFDNHARCITGIDVALGVLRGFNRSLLLELVGSLNGRHFLRRLCCVCSSGCASQLAQWQCWQTAAGTISVGKRAGWGRGRDRSSVRAAEAAGAAQRAGPIRGVGCGGQTRQNGTGMGRRARKCLMEMARVGTQELGQEI